MSDHDEPDLLDSEILGKSLREWNKSWKRIPGGFGPKRPELRHHVGLFRAVRDGQTMYIARATEHGKGGIEKGLQRIRGCPQTGNARYGAQMIRKEMEKLELEVLIVGSDRQAAEAAKQLKVAMIALHDPEWERPNQKHLKDLRAGNGS